MVFNPSSKKLVNIVLDTLHEEGSEKGLISLHFFAGMNLKRLGTSYSDLSKMIPKNISRIVLGEEAAKCALAQRVQTGALFYGLGLEQRKINVDKFDQETSTIYTGRGYKFI